MKRALLLITTLLLLCFSAHAQSAPDDGEITKGDYLNFFFNFAYTPPKDWVIHDEAVKKRIHERAQEEAARTNSLPQLKQTYALLLISRYPRPTAEIMVNATIIVAAEKITHLPGQPTAKDYLLSLRAPKAQRGVRAVREELLPFRVGDLEFLRDDYSGEIAGITIREALFVSVKKGYALIFSFTGGDEKSVEEMVKTMNTLLPLGQGPGRP
jgi:hypothetical protein